MALVVYEGPMDIPPAPSGMPNLYSTDATHRYVGLSNQGATCYLNGLLQTLFMTPEFRRAIFSWHYDASKHGAEEFCITLQLQRLFGLLQLSKERSVDTLALTHSFGWGGMEAFQQQDVQELTRVLFDALEQTFKGTEIETIIDDLYAGELIDYLRCIDVDYQSERVNKFLDFSLAIVPFGSDKPMHSLTECIETFLKPEILDGDNKYYAEKFDMKVDAIKGLKFGKLPQIMSVQLKRFVYDFTGPEIVQKKLNDVVKFPMILDMNRYVGKRNVASAARTEQEEAEEGLEERQSNEFEEFLRAQMDLLKKSRLATTAAAVENAQDPPVETEGAVASYIPAAAVETLASAVEAAMNFQPPVEAISEAPDYEDPFDASVTKEGLQTVDLLDATPAAAAVAPTAITETVDEQELEGADAGVVYGSMTAAEVAEMVARRGEWVYELYAVLIHSGVINGGHYYAYIKDLSTARWWNFNDSTVSSIDEAKVQEAWGKTNTYTYGGYPSYGTTNYYGTSLYSQPRSTNGSLSTANAYMLMYRKVSPQSPAAEGLEGHGTEASQPPGPLVSDDLVPQYIKDIVEAEAIAAEAARRAYEEERNRINVRVFFNGVEHTVPTTRTSTFTTLLTKVWNELGVKQHLGDVVQKHQVQVAERRAQQQAVQEDGAAADCQLSPSSAYGEASMQDDTGGTLTTTSAAAVTAAPALFPEDPESPCFDLFRLRNYNSYTQLKSETYDFEVAGSQTLEALGIREYRTFILETRSGEEEWEVYYVDGISLLLIEFDRVAKVFKEPRSLRLRRTATVGDIRQAVVKWSGLAYEHIRLMKITAMGMNDALLDVLSNDSTRLKEDLMVYDSYKLYFEAVFDPTAESAAYAAFVFERNMMDIRINRPPEAEFELTLKVDLRWSVQELRAFIAQSLGLEHAEIRVFKQSLRGIELRDGPGTLLSQALYNSIGLAVSLGKATPLGFFCVSLVEYVAVHNRVGIVELPILEDEVAQDAFGGSMHPIEMVELPPPPPPPPLSMPITILEEEEGAAVYADYNAELNAALDAAQDTESLNSNAGVADGDELQQCDDDLEALLEPEDTGSTTGAVSSAAASSSSGGVLETQGNTFEQGAAHVASNSELQSASCSLRSMQSDEACETPHEERGTASLPTVSALPLLHVCCTANAAEVGPLTPSPLPVEAEEDVPALVLVEEVGGAGLPSAVAEQVTPSDFGERMVSNSTSISDFHTVDAVTPVYVQEASTIHEVKVHIVEKLIASGRLPAGTSPNRIRVRDKLGTSPGRILTGNCTFRDYNIYMHDGKVMDYQVLDYEEDLVEAEVGSVVVLAQRFNRKEWRLEDRFEVLLRGSSSVQNIAKGLSLLTDIPFETMQVMVVGKDIDFYLSDLHLPSPPRNYGRAWFDPTTETRTLKTVPYTMRISDGDVLLLQDSAEPLRELTAADKKSIDIVHNVGTDMYGDWSSDPVAVSTNPFASSSGTTSTAAFSTVLSKTLKHGHNSSNGVVIRTQRDRHQEASDRSLNSTAAATAGDSVGAPSTGGASPLPPLEAVEAEYCENNMDAKEFNKQGGIALFSDIN